MIGPYCAIVGNLGSNVTKEDVVKYFAFVGGVLRWHCTVEEQVREDFKKSGLFSDID